MDLYDALLKFIVGTMNQYLHCEDTPACISIIDITGYGKRNQKEFNVNVYFHQFLFSGFKSSDYYDKLCINYLNDKIQCLFDRKMVDERLNRINNEDIFSQLDYVDHSDIIGQCLLLISYKFFNLSIVIFLDLFENPNDGIIAIVDKEFSLPRPDGNSLLQNLMKLSEKSPRIYNNGEFGIHHTGLDTVYSTVN